VNLIVKLPNCVIVRGFWLPEDLFKLEKAKIQSFNHTIWQSNHLNRLIFLFSKFGMTRVKKRTEILT